jgi:hypothetical protein
MSIGYTSKYKGNLKKESLKHPEKYAGKQDIVFRSKLEYDYMMVMDTNKSFKKWLSEELIIPYQNPLKEGRISRYYPDLIVQMEDKEKKLVNLILEIKPQSELDNVMNFKNIRKNTKKFFRAVQNKCKWDASIKFCEEQKRKTGEEWIFMVVTEKDLKRFKS